MSFDDLYDDMVHDVFDDQQSHKSFIFDRVWQASKHDPVVPTVRPPVRVQY